VARLGSLLLAGLLRAQKIPLSLTNDYLPKISLLIEEICCKLGNLRCCQCGRTVSTSLLYWANSGVPSWNSNEKVQRFNYTPSKFPTTNASGLCTAVIGTYSRLKINNTKPLYEFIRQGVKNVRRTWNKKIYFIRYLERHSWIQLQQLLKI